MKKSFIAIVSLLLTLHLSAQSNWSPEQCLKLKNISSIVPSPDGSKLLYTVREAIMTDERSEYVNQVWLCNADGSNALQLTKGIRTQESQMEPGREVDCVYLIERRQKQFVCLAGNRW